MKDTQTQKIDAAGLLEGTTPGPWQEGLAGEITGDVRGGIGAHVATIPAWIVTDKRYHKTRERQRANKSLIAAAPALAAEVVALRGKLDTARQALRVLLDVATPRQDPIVMLAATEQARAALTTIED